MNTLKIKIPEGFKIGAFDTNTGEVNFIPFPKSPRERFNVWEDILSFHNMTQEQFNDWCKGLRPHEIGDRETEMIAAAYNNRQLDDPLPTWGPNTGNKGYPLFNMPTPSGSGFSYIDYVNWNRLRFRASAPARFFMGLNGKKIYWML